jgi:phosphoribosylaminoimidazolecarboxamide formyltransferase/IMP cyclohydrolase
MGTDITKFKRTYRTRNEGEFNPHFKLEMGRVCDLKYGENPNQPAALYTHDDFMFWKISDLREDGRGKGGLSATNYQDIARAWHCLSFFKEPACAIMKHTVVSGFAKQTKKDQTLADLYRLARDSDRRSNFGGTVVVNRKLDNDTVDALLELYPNHIIDVVVAPDYAQGVVSRLQDSSNYIRIAQYNPLYEVPHFKGHTMFFKEVKTLPTGHVIVQEPYLSSIRSEEDLILDPMVVKGGKKYTIQTEPKPNQIDDMLTAWWINIAGSRSNGVVVVRDGVLVVNGTGQTERVGAVELAIIKGMQKAFDREGIKYDPLFDGITPWLKLEDNPFWGASCASDGFFPFPDAVERLSHVGVEAIVQPFGSVNDHLVIESANEHMVAMAATLERCFGHF